jgi:kynurenine--oxoglutarate transaminase/cysteine-S-conjugate beta-lyase/glutamine--phenylpyruvate transaminase
MRGIVAELVQKRDTLAKHLEGAGFKPIIPDAGYFMMADFSRHLGSSFRETEGKEGEGLDYEFCRWLCREKVANY